MLRELFLATSAFLVAASGTTCISGCSLDRRALLGDPPSIKASKGIFGASVEVDTAFSGEADLTPDGKLTHVSVNSDPVVVENARADALMKALPAFQMQRDLYVHQIDSFYATLDKVITLAAAGIPIPPELSGVLGEVGGTLDAPTLPGVELAAPVPAGPAVIVSPPE